jgi:hypothetical protein
VGEAYLSAPSGEKKSCPDGRKNRGKRLIRSTWTATRNDRVG